MFMGSHTMKDILSNLNEEIELLIKKDIQNFHILGIKKFKLSEKVQLYFFN